MMYLRYLLVTAVIFLAGVSSINYIADPAGVYRSQRNSPAYFVSELVNSERGLWWPENSFEDRAIKEALAAYSGQVECVLIGSSHIMQMGSARKVKSLEKICPSVLNLGVSGASIEDQIALTYLALKNGRPKKIVLGVNPWTFAYGKGQGWTAYAALYQDARREVFRGTHPSGADEENGVFVWRKLRNLISADYTIKSVRKIVSEFGRLNDPYAVAEVMFLDEATGGEHPALLRDGSLVYSAKYIADSLRPIPLGGAVYNTDGIINDRSAVNAYKALLRWITANSVTPVLLLTPYHQNVWAVENSQNTKALKETEPIVRQIAEDLRLEVLGSYDPKVIGCLVTEFYDFMHAKPSCLARLESYVTH